MPLPRGFLPCMPLLDVRRSMVRLVVKESDLQKQIIQWCVLSLRKDVVYWSTPNERNPKHNLGGMRAMGLLSGVADLVFIDSAEFCYQRVIFVELKRPTTYKMNKHDKLIIDQRGGKQSDNQKEFMQRVLEIDCIYDVIDNLDDFIELMKDYNLTK